tara:strand:+ start:1817 stop:3541 length:1725 start_codon:yes stop_codon:yes gene_type:complete
MSKKIDSSAILAITFGGHDTSAALMIGDELVAACAQERYTLDKHSRRFPLDAINDCLSIGKLNITDLDQIAFCDDTKYLVRERYLRPALEDNERLNFLLNDIEKIPETLSIDDRIRDETGFTGEIRQYRHHLCHLASAYYPSGFNEALLVSYDGMGEWETGLLGTGKDGEINVQENQVCFPHSLGLVYSAITFYLGWRHHCDEGIIMGLAPYGDPKANIPESSRTYIGLMEEMIVETGDFNYEIDQRWFSYYRERNKWVSDEFIELMGPKRESNTMVNPHHMNLAAALQMRLETVVLNQLKRARKQFDIPRLAMAGGVALNCSMNGKIESSGLFDEIFVQPGSGDDGTAIGGCYLARKTFNRSMKPVRMNNYYKGYRPRGNEIDEVANSSDLEYTKPHDFYGVIAERLASGKIVAWFQGGAEFGPRALGNRSILAKPYPESMKDFINERVKFREYFRPFAGAILFEHLADYCDISQLSPHMLIACKIHEERQKEVSAVVHVDGTCRIQTVDESDNLRFRKLIEAFYRLTGVPVILNTSFNVKGQPIVNTPQQAIDTFKKTNLDCLALGDLFFEK